MSCLLPSASMPPGVEHSASARRSSCDVHLPSASMPLGVEHKTSAAAKPAALSLPSASMPPGVEHYYRPDDTTAQNSALRLDAPGR